MENPEKYLLSKPKQRDLANMGLENGWASHLWHRAAQEQTCKMAAYAVNTILNNQTK